MLNGLIIAKLANLKSKIDLATSLLVTLSVTSEGTSGGELTELMPDHLFCDINWNMLTTVVNGDRMSNHLGNDCGCPRPGFNNLFFVFIIEHLNFFKQVIRYEWAFFK
jgi:hypothetical protein